jgi:hypothetical protein
MPTDCTAWDVRKIALHVLGSADAQASVREFGFVNLIWTHRSTLIWPQPGVGAAGV